MQQQLRDSLNQHNAARDTQAVARERERIYRDLHDDLGAELLDLVYLAPSPEHADRARGVLRKLKEIVAAARRPPAPLLELLAEPQLESQRRTVGADISLIWEQQPALPDLLLSQQQTLHLGRILREAVSNALRHSGAQRLRVRVTDTAGRLGLEVTDDGQFNAQPFGQGGGTMHMQQRAADLGGDIEWNEGSWGGPPG